MRKMHVNEFRRTEFADSGRIAGTGITEDRYDDEASPRAKPLNYQKPSAFDHSQRKPQHGEVITYKAPREETNK